jgi:hypothetical protein
MKIYHNVFDAEEIKKLTNFYSTLPIVSEKRSTDGQLFRNIKNTEYNLQDELPYQIIHPKLEKLIGQHRFTGGHYLDAHQPYVCHIDTIPSFNKRDVPVHESLDHRNLGILIPLVENKHFHTIFFNHYLESLNPGYMNKISCNSDTTLEPEIMALLDHHTAEELSNIAKFKLDTVADWVVGSVLSWDRNQLHCSGNFAKYGLTKQAIVLWV